MADEIKKYTDQIANATYGEEVRIAIINALNECYRLISDTDESIENEVRNARTGYDADGSEHSYNSLGETIRNHFLISADARAELLGKIIGTSGMVQRKYIINAPTDTSDGYWGGSNARHFSINITGGDTVKIVANQDNPAVCAFLKSDNAAPNVDADFCSNSGGQTWQGRIVISKGESATYTAPSDCNVLYIAVRPHGVEQNLIPDLILINGVDISSSLRSKVAENSDNIESITNKITGYENNYLGLERYFKLIDTGLKMNLDISDIRATLPSECTKVSLPNYEHLSDYDLPLYTDGNKYVHGIDLTQYKNSSSNTVTVHNSSELSAALTNATPGDNIILDGGFYGPVTITKSINLIGRNNPLFTSYPLNEFKTTQVSTVYRTVNAYSFSHSEIYDITGIEKGLVLPLTAAPNISSCINNAGTYFMQPNDHLLCLHLYGGNHPLGNVAVVKGDQNVISLDGSQASCKWYLEGITVVGGKSCIYAVDSEDYLTQTVIGVDCKTYYAQTSNNIFMLGVNALFQRCLAMGAYLDGFNYHEPSTRDGDVANGFEVDCIGHDNGSRQEATAPTNNGSTIHDGGKIVRINGLYYNNNGGNVADASPNTESYNYGCVTFDSKAPYDNADETSADFWARYAHMYLYGCRALGDSQYNLRVYDDGDDDHYDTGCIYVDSRTEYDQNKVTGDIVSI